jgi:predicted mannosyl-3-phosphoglycerate phosphatase (HAD superfamily)
LKQPSVVVYLALDAFLPLGGKPEPGLFSLLGALEERSIPVVLVSGRSRLQMDDARRRLDHAHPFIAESGSAVFIPEDYFHRKIEGGMRMGRFLCMPVATPQPAAREALDALCEAAGISVVTLRSLSPRELAQNTGLPVREAEMVRQGDFEEYFFFAGSSDEDIARFRQIAAERGLSLHEDAPLWGLSVGADLARAVKQTSALYDKSFHGHLATVGVQDNADESAIAEICKRGIRIVRGRAASGEEVEPSERLHTVPVRTPEDWAQLADLLNRRE